MGWERKRGKIEEFNRLLRGATDTSFSTQVGELRRAAVGPLLHHPRLRHAPAARRRQAADRHHRASAEPAALRSRALGRVTEGYGILQPRVSVTMASAAGSLFARTYAGHTGVDPVHHRRVRRLPGPVRRRASSPARASTTSTRSPRRSRAACRRTRCCRTISSRASTRARPSSPTSRWSTTTRRACSRTRGASTAGCAATGRSCGGCSRSCRRATGMQRNRLPLISRWKILDNLRRSLMPPATLAPAAARLDRPAGLRRCVDRRSALAPLALSAVALRVLELLRGPRRGQSWRRVPAHARSRI